MICTKCGHGMTYSVCNDDFCTCICSPKHMEVIKDPLIIAQTIEAEPDIWSK